jgi:hypothetical protein
LEGLCKSSDSEVREKTIAGFYNVLGLIDIKKNEDILFAMIKRLNSSDYFCSK